MTNPTLSANPAAAPTLITPVKQQAALESYFPPIECPLAPIEDRIVVQMRRPNPYTGALIISSDSISIEYANQTVAKIIAAGPKAAEFLANQGLVIGDFVRIPLHGADKIEVECPEQYYFVRSTAFTGSDTLNHNRTDQTPIILFTLRCYEIQSKITVDPRKIKTYLPTKF